MATHAPQDAERRNTPRIHFGGKLVLATIPDIGSITLGVVQNVSRGGMQVNFSQHIGGLIEKSKQLTFEILEDYFGLQGEGEIAWISSDGSMAGINFFPFDEENKRSLEHFLGMTG